MFVNERFQSVFYKVSLSQKAQFLLFCCGLLGLCLFFFSPNWHVCLSQMHFFEVKPTRNSMLFLFFFLVCLTYWRLIVLSNVVWDINQSREHSIKWEANSSMTVIFIRYWIQYYRIYVFRNTFLILISVQTCILFKWGKYIHLFLGQWRWKKAISHALL